MTKEKLIQELEGAANFLRGMSLDPRLPESIKQAVLSKVEDLDKITEEASS